MPSRWWPEIWSSAFAMRAGSMPVACRSSSTRERPLGEEEQRLDDGADPRLGEPPRRGRELLEGLLLLVRDVDLRRGRPRRAPGRPSPPRRPAAPRARARLTPPDGAAAPASGAAPGPGPASAGGAAGVSGLRNGRSSVVLLSARHVVAERVARLDEDLRRRGRPRRGAPGRSGRASASPSRGWRGRSRSRRRGRCAAPGPASSSSKVARRRSRSTSATRAMASLMVSRSVTTSCASRAGRSRGPGRAPR